MDQSLADRNVILVEDILDTGLTLNYISKLVDGPPAAFTEHCRACSTNRLGANSRYRRVTSASVFPMPMSSATVSIMPRRYRNLPDICVIENP